MTQRTGRPKNHEATEQVMTLFRENIAREDIARRLGFSKGKVNGIIWRNRDPDEVKRSTGVNRGGRGLFGYDKEILDQHGRDTQAEEDRRELLRSFLR